MSDKLNKFKESYSNPIETDNKKVDALVDMFKTGLFGTAKKFTDFDSLDKILKENASEPKLVNLLTGSIKNSNVPEQLIQLLIDNLFLVYNTTLETKIKQEKDTIKETNDRIKDYIWAAYDMLLDIFKRVIAPLYDDNFIKNFESLIVSGTPPALEQKIPEKMKIIKDQYEILYKKIHADIKEINNKFDDIIKNCTRKEYIPSINKYKQDNIDKLKQKYTITSFMTIELKLFYDKYPIDTPAFKDLQVSIVETNHSIAGHSKQINMTERQNKLEKIYNTKNKDLREFFDVSVLQYIEDILKHIQGYINITNKHKAHEQSHGARTITNIKYYYSSYMKDIQKFANTIESSMKDKKIKDIITILDDKISVIYNNNLNELKKSCDAIVEAIDTQSGGVYMKKYLKYKHKYLMLKSQYGIEQST